MQTLPHHFAQLVPRCPDEPLFRTLSSTLSCAEVARLVARGSEQLRQLNLRPGDKIVCFTDQTIPLALMLLSGSLSRVIAAPLSPVFSTNYLQELCKQAGAKAIFTTPENLHRLGGMKIPVLCHAGGVGCTLTISGVRSDVRADHVMFEEGDDSPLDDHLDVIRRRAEEVQLEDAFLIQPTSGSSGRPKLVLRSHYGFSRYAQYVGDQAQQAFPAGYRPRMLAVNALTHAFAGHMMAMALRLGLEIAVPTDIDMAVALHEVRELDPDVLPVTPRVLRSLVRQHENKTEPEDAPLFGERARVLLSAGGKGDPNIFQRLVDQGMEVLEFYGSSEASIVALTPCGGWKKNCAGKPVADVNLRFSRDREVLVRSPGIMLGYYGDEELTSLVVDGEGFYHTGDLGSVDEHGYLRIDGRKRDLFNTPEGTNIYPERIEILIESLSYVKQAFLVGDCLPYLTVHIVLDAHEGNGLLDEAKASEAYRTVGKDLSEINDDLETIEQIVAFALYGSPFESDVYRVVTAGKVRRDRPRFYHKYAKPIRRLYSQELHHRSDMLVPPKERRFRKRQGAR